MSTLRAVENFTTGVGLIPEQIWDAPDIPEQHMFFGKADWGGHSADVGARRVCKIVALGGGQAECSICIDPVAERYRNDQAASG